MAAPNRGTIHTRKQVAGPVAIGADGAPMVAGLRLAGVDPALIGQRAVLQGSACRRRLRRRACEGGKRAARRRPQGPVDRGLCRTQRQWPSRWLRASGQRRRRRRTAAQPDGARSARSIARRRRPVASRFSVPQRRQRARRARRIARAATPGRGARMLRVRMRRRVGLAARRPAWLIRSPGGPSLPAGPGPAGGPAAPVGAVPAVRRFGAPGARRLRRRWRRAGGPRR